MQDGVDQFQQQTACVIFDAIPQDYFTAERRHSSDRGFLPFAAQRNYFLIQSARDGALNKRLTQSVLSTHTRLNAQ
jgi:hypothetical protein